MSPVDAVGRALNKKTRYPPIHLRRHAGPLEAFERTAGEYAGYLVTLAGLRPTSHVLDVGCGPGAMAITLNEKLGPDGRYVGLDVYRDAVDWASKHLSDTRISFKHHDYWSGTYNPTGVRFLPFDIDDGWADTVLLKSVITHLLPDDVTFYLGEIRRVLALRGRAVVTAFLFEEVDDEVASRFPYDQPPFRYSRRGSPESAVAYQRDWMINAFEKADLRAELKPGLWHSGRDAPVAYQDMILARIRGEHQRGRRVARSESSYGVVDGEGSAPSGAPVIARRKASSRPEPGVILPTSRT
jgi:SAM-dependent methyltransferase